MDTPEFGDRAPEEAFVQQGTLDIKHLISEYPQLGDSRLVIEGGVGPGKHMKSIVSNVFPDALYVGTDLAFSLFATLTNPRGEQIRKSVNVNQLEAIKKGDAIVYANCFDNKLISDIANKTGRNPVLLTSIGALRPLMGTESHLGEVIGFDNGFSGDAPYTGQIHLLYPSLEDYRKKYPEIIKDVENSALRNGWDKVEFPTGLAFLKAQQNTAPGSF